MKKIFTVLGVLLAATSGFLFFAGRKAEQQINRVPAKKAAEMLAEAWSDHHTRA